MWLLMVNLIISASLAQNSQTEQEPQEGQTEAPKTTVELRSTIPGMQVGMVVGRSRSSGVGYGAGGTVYASMNSTTTRDLCTAPCIIEIQPGTLELFAKNEDWYILSDTFNIQSGRTIIELQPIPMKDAKLAHRMKNGGQHLAIAGSALLVVAGTMSATNVNFDIGGVVESETAKPVWRLPLVSGGVLTAGGISLFAVGRSKVKNTTGNWEIVEQPSSQNIEIIQVE